MQNASSNFKKRSKLLWIKKPLPNGKTLELFDNKSGSYLYHQSALERFGKVSIDYNNNTITFE
jgi:hypothetical protein